MKLTHKQKVKKARRLLSQVEKSTYMFIGDQMIRKPRTPIFLSRKWSAIKQAKAAKVHEQYQYGKQRGDIKINEQEK